MATRTYTGNAQAINQRNTVTIALTWAAADTITLTVNGKDLVLTVGTAFATTDVATALKQAFQSEAMGAGYSVLPTGGGTVIPELSVITASVSGSVVTLTADTAGIPFTITVTESTVGTGTATGAVSQAATGPSFFDNVDNYAEGAVPITGDDLVWNRPVSIKYALAQSAITLASLTIGPAVTGAYQIGLLSRNPTGYEEYLATELAISVTSLVCNGTPGLVKINCGSVANTSTVNSTGGTLEDNRSAFQIRGTNTGNVLSMFGGDVGYASNNETSAAATINQNGGVLNVGTGVASLVTVSQLSGTATVNCAATNISSSGGTLKHTAGAVTTVKANGGTVTLASSGTITTCTQRGGKLVVTETAGAFTTLNGVNGKCQYNGAGTISTLTLANDHDFSVDGSSSAVTISSMAVTGGPVFRNVTGRATITALTAVGVIDFKPL